MVMLPMGLGIAVCDVSGTSGTISSFSSRISRSNRPKTCKRVLTSSLNSSCKLRWCSKRARTSRWIASQHSSRSSCTERETWRHSACKRAVRPSSSVREGAGSSRPLLTSFSTDPSFASQESSKALKRSSMEDSRRSRRNDSVCLSSILSSPNCSAKRLSGLDSPGKRCMACSTRVFSRCWWTKPHWRFRSCRTRRLSSCIAVSLRCATMMAPASTASVSSRSSSTKPLSLLKVNGGCTSKCSATTCVIASCKPSATSSGSGKRCRRPSS
mmetsp:Transcript_3282/g.7640  ORF Transcript_3282/g.7640 Transcript_3282/m.7640 type:complete len:270 (-) Transcript_3282:87-896(-)